MRFSGRYNRGLDEFGEREVWPALYLAVDPETCLGEVLRHVSAGRLGQLNEYRISRLSLDLELVLDCRDPSKLGLAFEDLSDDVDYRVPQALAAAAIAQGAEAILVPSATRLGENIIVFPAQLRLTSRIVIVDGRDPRLYVVRDE